MRLEGEADKSRKKAGGGEWSFEWREKREDKVGMYRVWARGERSETELGVKAGSPMKGLGSQQDKCSNPWDFEHPKGSLGKTTPVLMWSGTEGHNYVECGTEGHN